MLESFIDVKVAAELTNENERTVRRKMAESKYISRTILDSGVGRGGTKLQVLLSSLPADAQLKFLKQRVHSKVIEEQNDLDLDLVAYREKYGEPGINEFIKKFELVQQALNIERVSKGNKTELWEELAADHQISKRSLDRMVSGFREEGAKSLMKKVDRIDKGRTRSTCLGAKAMMIEKRLDKMRRSKTRVFQMVSEYAEIKGEDACINCVFRNGSKHREEVLESGVNLPECEELMKDGMKMTRSIQTASRILLTEIPDEIHSYAVYGKKAWQAAFMAKATREKPQRVNEVWFGDHHVLDVFIKDMDGKLVKPWLTAWYDAATGCVVGWCLSTNPNSQTIAEAFVYGVVDKKDFPFSGLPEAVYTDNGRDYRSHAFEGERIVEKSFGKGMPLNVETKGILIQLGIDNTHAKPYQGWSKPIERFFGTFADKYVRELPGWCGRHPDERPEGHEKELKRLSAQNKLYTMEMLMDWMIRVLKDYHNSPHSGYNNQKPIERYMALERARNDKPSWAILGVLKLEFEERMVTTQGIKFDGCLYWHKELSSLVREKVQIRFNRQNKDVLIIIHKGRTICAASIKERLKMVNEDKEVLAKHMSNQKNQENDVRNRIAELTGKAKPKQIKVSQSNLLIPEVMDNYNGNITSIEFEKAMKAYNAANEELKTVKTENGTVDQSYLDAGELLLKKVMNK